jgi:hypothetical protein
MRADCPSADLAVSAIQAYMGFASPTQGRESPYPYVGVDGPSDDGLLTFAEYVDRGNYDNELLQYTSLSEGQGAKITHMPPQPTVCLACRLWTRAIWSPSLFQCACFLVPLPSLLIIVPAHALLLS